MNRELLISIIVPAYNAETVLPRCLKSLLDQTYQNLQILVVNDGSSDDTLRVAQEWAAKDARINALSNPGNIGASATRNRALRLVEGSYVMFVDSDDFIEPWLVEEAVRRLSERPADSLVFGFTEDYFDEHGQYVYSEKIEFPEYRRFEKDEMRRYVIELEKMTMYGYTCDKLFRIAKIREENIQYPSLPLAEDFFFNVDYFQNAESMILIPGAPYHYQKKLNNSLTNQFVAEYYPLHVRRVLTLWQQHEAWGILTPEVQRDLANIYARYLVSALQRNCDARANMTRRDRRAFLQEVYASEPFQRLMPHAHSDSRALRLFIRQFRRKNLSLTLFLGHLVYLVRQKAPILFGKMKKNR
ncbi:MAG: glycosyltransferase family A protein [Ndongobacter sp.]|nr:glycosyltransferase family A protein [Ndongobacter sp.]